VIYPIPSCGVCSKNGTGTSTPGSGSDSDGDGGAFPTASGRTSSPVVVGRGLKKVPPGTATALTLGGVVFVFFVLL
jgi:hypothetical protein